MKGILLDENGDLMVRDGHLATGEIDAQAAQGIIRAWQGEFKEAPLLGGNIVGMVNGAPSPFWAGNIKSQLKSQLIGVERLDITAEGIELRIKN
jgi:hypothetical protein